MSILTQDFVRDAINAEKAGCKMPVYFDDVWQEIGYSRKDSAKRSLVNSPLKNGIDYHIHNNEQVVDSHVHNNVDMVNRHQTNSSKKSSHLLNNEQVVKRPR